MRLAKSVLFLFIALTVFGCKKEQKVIDESLTSPSISTFYFIRHAEKDRSDPDNVDPELTQAGLGRAMYWAEILNNVNLDAIYTTDFERTSMTAAPTSVKKDINVQYYNPDDINIEQFKADNLNKKVLIVGHSNTTPNMVNKMIGEDKYSDMDDNDNGSLFIVQIVNGIPTDTRLSINCNCPSGR